MELDVRGSVRWRSGCLLVLMGVLMLQECSGHIRLTYPPARKYNFDFLDNVRTPAPCGMPSGLDNNHTNLRVGEELDIHWHLSYPHQGGYFFEIRDQDNMVKARYPNSSFMGSEDGTSLHYKLTLPDKACDGCTFRMVRQAMEWGGSYLFWSCADINIMEADALPQSDMCSGHGTYQNGACSCEKLYTGEKCQFKEECESDEDCGQHGMCVDTQATSFPKHQCYCSAGWFGPQCQHQSAVSSPPSDMSVYTSRTFSPASASDVTVHYRLVQDEVEVVLKAKTVSWIGFGWRPAGAKASCQNFPDLGDDMYDMSKADGGAEAEGESEAEASAEGHNSTAEAEPGSDGNATAEAEAKAEAEGHNATAEAESNAEAEGHNSTAEAESKAEAEGNSTAEAESKAEAEGHNATAEAESNAGAEGHNSTAEAESKAEAGQNSTAEAESNAEAEGHNSTAEAEGHNSTAEAEAKAEAEGHNSTAEAEAKAEGEGHNATAEGTAGDGSAEAEGAAEGEAEAEGGSALHPMDCTDLVIGSARGGYSRIGDYYTRDRSTPVHDEYLGGRNDLTAALVWEEGEHTFMLFRKKLTSDDPADHSLLDEQTHVLWAIGQERNAQGRYNHNPNTPSALETENVVITDFYRLDELKYHGHSGQRGAATLNFYPDVADDGEEPDNCMQGSCSKKVCGFDFSWVYDPESDTITFTISAKYVAPDQWLAIGFSDDVNMPNTDVAYGGIGPDGAAFVKDGWLFDKKPPRMDDSQDVTLVSGQHVNSTTTLVFSRKRSTGDSDDLDLTQCRYVFFAKGGKVGANGAISKHSSTPTVSAEKICFGVCQAAATGTTYITPVTIRLPGAQFRDTYRDTDSQDYKQLVGKLQTVLEAHFRGRFGSVFDSVNIIELRPGSIVVVFEVVTKSTEGAAKVQQDMKTAAAELETQTIDGYGAVEFEQVADTYRADGLDSMVESDLLTEVEIIIIAVVLALVLVAFLIGICKFIEARRSKQNDKQRVMGETSSTSSGSKDTGKKGTMTYGQFMATSHDADAKHLPPYPAFGNPGYETAGYKNVP